MALSPLQNVHWNSVVSSLHVFCVRFVTQKAHSFGVDVVQLYVLVIRQHSWILKDVEERKVLLVVQAGFSSSQGRTHLINTEPRREKMLD